MLFRWRRWSVREDVGVGGLSLCSFVDSIQRLPVCKRDGHLHNTFNLGIVKPVTLCDASSAPRECESVML